MGWLDDLDQSLHRPGSCRRKSTTAAAAVDRIQSAEEDLTAPVLRARRAGASWNHLALALGVSRQAARQRFAALAKSSTPVS